MPPLNFAAVVARLGELNSVKPGLERTEALLKALGHPERSLRGVLVAGTNGKGSVCAVMESVCRAAGWRTGLLTNPHLRSYCERIAISGTPISERAFVELMADVLAVAPSVEAEVGAPSQFELLTAAGVLAASRAAVDVLVCEVGLGGRLDSTNVLDLGLAVITNVSLEHEEFLGSTVELIAAEKAAIIKPGNQVVTGAVGGALEVIAARAEAVGAQLSCVGRDIPISGRELGLHGIEVSLGSSDQRATTWRLPLRGRYQIANAGVALAACRELSDLGLGLDAGALTRGAAAVTWPGRMEWREGRPAVLLDGAHNAEGMDAFAAAAADLCQGRRLVVVFAAMRDKNTMAMLAALKRLTSLVVFTRVSSERAQAPEELAASWGADCRSADGPQQALRLAGHLAGPDGAVAVCGSLYLVGEVLELLDGSADREETRPSSGPRPASP